MRQHARSVTIFRKWPFQAVIGLVVPLGLSLAGLGLIGHNTPLVRANGLPPGEASEPTPTSTPDHAHTAPTLADFWNGTAGWALDKHDVGLPVGESDTIDMGNGVLWSYLHASTESAGVTDSCGDPVSFPGCVTRWVSTDGGMSFTLPEPTCLIACKSCPCAESDKTRQQQYPRVVRAQSGTFYMVFEHDAEAWITRSQDGLNWVTPTGVAGTGTWNGDCINAMRIGPHPFVESNVYDCMAGGPPGITIVGNNHLTVFAGFGQNPGHMGCFQSPGMTISGFHRCPMSVLFSGSPTYGPLDVDGGLKADPYFDFRYITSADVIRVGEYYYMAFEGVRGPSAVGARDTQFGLGFARSKIINTTWEEYPGNPVLEDVADNWGIGHADLLVVDGTTIMYTATPELTRGRYVLVWK